MITQKNSCSSKTPHPTPHNFFNGPFLSWSTKEGTFFTHQIDSAASLYGVSRPYSSTKQTTVNSAVLCWSNDKIVYASSVWRCVANGRWPSVSYSDNLVLAYCLANKNVTFIYSVTFCEQKTICKFSYESIYTFIIYYLIFVYLSIYSSV